MEADIRLRVDEIVDRLLDDAGDALDPRIVTEAAREALRDEPEAVRREVESLLPHLVSGTALVAGNIAESAPRLLAGLAREESELPVGAAQSVGAGDRVGPWRLLEELGRGGMGVVFLAERADRQFEKRVAIKMVGATARSRDARRRFLRERQILASLEHPSVARLLDGGVTEDGTPYLVMELVEGEPIDRWCRRTEADLDRRLELFLEVCDAVQAAHDLSIVHRDLKPGNILVTPDGRVKLLDFGIAALIEQAGTVPAATVVHAFTPEYASPEQVRLEHAGAASDVYALGVLLYALLARRLPYAIGGLRPAEVEHVVCTVEPPLASAALLQGSDDGLDHRARVRLARRQRGDLDQVIAKALAKEPVRRYRDAGELARDVRRHLRGVPVEARPATAGYRARRFVGRHRIGVAASAGVLLSLVVGLVVAASQAARAARERDLARAEAVKARTVSEFLTELFDQANPFEAGTTDARDLLRRGESKIASELADHPAVRADLLGAMSRAYLGLADYPAAERLATEALELERSLLPPDSPELAAALLDRANVASALGDPDAALTFARAALAALEEGGDTSGEIAVRAHRALGELERRHDLGVAEAHLVRAIELRRKLTPGTSTSLAQLLHDLGTLREAQGRAAEGLELKREALAMLETVADPGAPILYQMRSNLAFSMTHLGRFEEAERLHRAALSGLEARLGASHPGLIAGLTSYGNLLMTLGRFDEAAPLVERAVQLAADHDLLRFDAVGARVNLGTLRREQGRVEEALEVYRGARQSFLELGLGDGTPAAARVDSLVGQALLRVGRFEAAREHLERALAVQASAPGIPPAVIAESRAALGAALCRLERPQTGYELMEEACTAIAQSVGAENWQSAACAIELAACEIRLGRDRSAAGRLRSAEPILRERLPGNGYWSARFDSVRESLAGDDDLALLLPSL